MKLLHAQLDQKWLADPALGTLERGKPFVWMNLELLPDLSDVDDMMSFLEQLGPRTSNCTLFSPENNVAHVDEIDRLIRAKGFELPTEFSKLVSSHELQVCVETSGACYLDIDENLLSVPGFSECLLLRFMRHSQDCVVWYLLFEPDCPVRVVASRKWLDEETFAGPESLLAHQLLRDCAFISANSFLEFICRFSIENAIWFALHWHNSRELTQREALYLKEFRPAI